MINLLILDIDGVMTDGTKVYDENHKVISKSYCDRDFTAIKRMKDADVKVCFLSGDKSINEGMANKRNVDFFYSRNKLETLEQILDNYKCWPQNTCYIGDDIYDIPVLKRVGYSFCPDDSPVDVKSACKYKLLSSGCNSVVAEFYDFCCQRDLMPKSFLGIV